MKWVMIGMFVLELLLLYPSNLMEIFMEKFKVVVEETISQTFEIEAEDFEKATEILRSRYAEGSIVLDNASRTFVQYAFLEPDPSEWELM